MEKIKILFAASEAVPFIKTGGLADVVGSLPKYFDPGRYDCRIILPKYECIDWQFRANMRYRTHFYMDLAWRNQYVGVQEMVQDGITFYFIDNEFYFRGRHPYADMPWDMEKFAFFSRAVLSALPSLNFRPDVIHCHDWQAAMIPVYLNDVFQQNPFYRGIKTVMTVHNLKFQGIWSEDALYNILGLPSYYFADDKLEAYRNVNLLKGGIVYADRVTTVSESYAGEIQTPFYGEGLDGLMRAKSNALSGIVNGIDYAEFDPETDNKIPFRYDVQTVIGGKARNKLALQKELGLPEDERVMMLGMVSRLTDQKGLDLITCVLDELCDGAIQLVILGSGEKQYENTLRSYAEKYPAKLAVTIGYNEALSHRIYASCDAFLMPSLFEPCGLAQLMSLRYGTLPIVRETGGLRDTVEPYNEYEQTGTGFGFCNFNAHEMLYTVRYAEKIYYDRRDDWNAMVQRAMQKDFSWSASAKKYQTLYDDLCESIDK